jgi:uncharacterized protein
MDLSLLGQNLLAPPVLFFAAGLLAVAVRSDLEIPQPLPRLFSLYLLLAIGFRGGAELRHAGFSGDALRALGAGLAMSVAVPLAAFPVLRRKVSDADAGAIAAAYGSVSAVTFITAAAFLDRLGIAYGGYMVAALAVMESPAIVVGVMLVRRRSPAGGSSSSTRALLHDAFLNGSVFLLLASLAVGLASGEPGRNALRPFTDALFPGILCLFLLDMGMVAARRLADLRRAGAFLVGFALLAPLASAAAAIVLARLAGLGAGDALLLTVLCASASYIAVPAAMRIAVPEANPGLFLPLAIGVTFPFNVAVGIPLYLELLRWLGATP